MYHMGRRVYRLNMNIVEDCVPYSIYYERLIYLFFIIVLREEQEIIKIKGEKCVSFCCINKYSKVMNV